MEKIHLTVYSEHLANKSFPQEPRAATGERYVELLWDLLENTFPKADVNITLVHGVQGLAPPRDLEPNNEETSRLITLLEQEALTLMADYDWASSKAE